VWFRKNFRKKLWKSTFLTHIFAKRLEKNTNEKVETWPKLVQKVAVRGDCGKFFFRISAKFQTFGNFSDFPWIFPPSVEHISEKKWKMSRKTSNFVSFGSKISRIRTKFSNSKTFFEIFPDFSQRSRSGTKYKKSQKFVHLAQNLLNLSCFCSQVP
jgi:hypothetical protein